MSTKAKRRAKTPITHQPAVIQDAIRSMKYARGRLRACGCKAAADYVARAMKSAEGAHRHASRMRSELLED
jgi:hypothetical protein